MNQDAIETLVVCPACEACSHCRGTGHVTCRDCPVPHKMECPSDAQCGVCQGIQMCSAVRRWAWLQDHPPVPPRTR